jgi:hypothetical protein
MKRFRSILDTSVTVMVLVAAGLVIGDSLRPWEARRRAR